MTLVARRRAAVLVPWLALAAVTAFAIVQMRARHAATQAGAPRPAEAAAPSAPPSTAPSRGPSAGVAAEASEAALDAALVDLESARAEAGRLAGAEAISAGRAEAAEAQLAVSTARVAALEAELTALRTAAAEQPAPPPVEATPAPAEPTGALLAWVEDAVANRDDLARRHAVLQQAASATAAQIAGLEALRATGADPVALARLAAALPAGDETDALVIGLLMDDRTDFGTASRVVNTLGSGPLRRPVVLDVVLGRVPPGTLKVALGLLAGYASELGDAEKRAALTAVLTPRLESTDASQLHAAARAAGLLRLPGTAPRLVQLLDHEVGSVRIAAAHALSLVPDLDVVRAGAVKALSRLLVDGALSERTAGALLAEALVGETLEVYDPAAGEGARRAALDAILDLLD